MKISFQMTGDDYVAGWKQKNKLNRKDKIVENTVIILIVALIAAYVLFTKNYYLLIIIGFFIAFQVFNSFMEYKLRNSEFCQSPALNSKNTINIYDGGIEILGSFKKIFVPFCSVYKVVESRTHLILLPTNLGNVYSINKEKYQCEELVEIINKLKEKLPSDVYKEVR